VTGGPATETDYAPVLTLAGFPKGVTALVTYRFLPHTADVLLEIAAPSLSALLADATSIVRELLVGGSRVDAQESRHLTVTADGPDELLLRFMNELFAEFQLSTFVPTRLDIDRVTPIALTGSVQGEPFNDAKHEAQPEVKAVTRHRLDVTQTESGWQATVVLDL